MKKLSVMSMLLLLCSGCLASRNDGNVKYLVLGFGYVQFNEVHREAAHVSNVRVLGATLSTEPGNRFSLGYLRSSYVSVGTNENFLAEVESKPGSGIKLTVPLRAP